MLEIVSTIKHLLFIIDVVNKFQSMHSPALDRFMCYGVAIYRSLLEFIRQIREVIKQLYRYEIQHITEYQSV